MPFDLLAWAQSRIPGGRVGSSGYYNACCPLHIDSRPSFGLHLTTGAWKCKAASCGRKGNLARLIHELDGLPWRDVFALLDQPNPFGVDDAPHSIQPNAQPSRPTVNLFPPDLVPVSDQRFPSYLRERGYGLQDALSFGLHFGDDSAGQFRGYLVFPFWDLDATYVTFMARRMSEQECHGPRYQQPDQGLASRQVYGAWRFRGVAWTERIFVVEGPFDVLRMWSFGLPAVGLSTSAASSAQVNQLVALSRAFSAPLCVLLDRGTAERDRADTIVTDLFVGRGVQAYRGDLPEGVKDPDNLTSGSVEKLLDNCNAHELQLTGSVGNGDGRETGEEEDIID